MSGAQAPSMDLLATLKGVLSRWKLVATITLVALVTTYCVVKFAVPSRYKSTVEILVYDPQQQIDATVQKPISPFVDALGSDAINTEINILKSKSVALRVASELGLDTDPEFQVREFRIGGLVSQLGVAAERLGITSLAERLGLMGLSERLGIADLAERLGFAGPGRADDNAQQSISAAEQKAEKLDQAADELVKRLEVWQESYIIFVSATIAGSIQSAAPGVYDRQ